MALAYARYLAATNTPGRQVRGANSFTRSARQRRRAFEKEMAIAVRAFCRVYPDFVPPPRWEDRHDVCKTHPDFAALCAKLEGLAARFGLPGS